MPKFLEEKLKREYPDNPHAVYGTLNARGLMHGNKETAKGRALEAKHNKDVKAGTASTSKPKKKKAQASGLNWRQKWGRNKVKG